jgi:hypothetical protein
MHALTEDPEIDLRSAAPPGPARIAGEIRRARDVQMVSRHMPEQQVGRQDSSVVAAVGACDEPGAVRTDSPRSTQGVACHG